MASGFGKLADPAAAGQVQLDRLFLVIVFVVLVLDELAGVLRGPTIGFGFEFFVFAGQRADDQRRAGLVDENAVGLVDQHEVQLALHGLLVARARLAPASRRTSRAGLR